MIKSEGISMKEKARRVFLTALTCFLPFTFFIAYFSLKKMLSIEDGLIIPAAVLGYVISTVIALAVKKIYEKQSKDEREDKDGPVDEED